MRVLIAEDEAVSRTVLKKAVEKFGHECLVAEDGEKAWELFQSTSEVDVIISDWMMPGIEGLELCRRVRQTSRPEYTFFIFLTMLGDKKHLLEGMRAGADDYLAKPLDIEQLEASLIAASRVISLHRKLEEEIAERKLAEERLREANRHLEELAALRADFTAMVAHEIGSPLATVRGFLEVLATGELEPADRADILAKVRSEIDGLSILVADVSSSAAVEREDFALVSRRTSIDELFEDAARFAGTLPGEHPLTTRVEADGQVLVDPYRIGQVLRNLLSNAAKHSPNGAPIELRARPGATAGLIRIEVADHGHGIHPEDVDRIFEKFGRGRDRSGRKWYGVGLGLYLSRRIVRAHGGELTLEPAPGGGTVFSFELEVTG